jgi:RecB family endonuclease NucS
VLRRLLADGRALHEVPVSLGREGLISRGVLDLLVLGDGTATVVELKTGRPTSGHDAQLAAYVSAATRLLPEKAVDGVLVYRGGGED